MISYQELNRILRGCIANPSSVDHRLVYADALDDFGLDDHAGLVRYISKLQWYSNIPMTDGGVDRFNEVPYYAQWWTFWIMDVWQPNAEYYGDHNREWYWKVAPEYLAPQVHTRGGRAPNLANAQRRAYRELMTHRWKRGCICQYLEKVIQ